MKHPLCAALMLICTGLLFAQTAADSDLASLEDELFGGDEETVLTQEQTSMEQLKSGGLSLSGDLAAASVTLESAKFRIGGALDSKLELGYRWTDPYTGKKAFTDADGSVGTFLNANLFFDARPVENLKLYGKFGFGFPFEKQLSGSISVPPGILSGPLSSGVLLGTSVNGSPNINIKELYTDFSAKDIAFFRFGKHTVKWGTGYFYSPADVINLSRIDPEDPEADREGAVSLRTHIIIPKTQHNIWLYLLPPMKQDNYKPEYTAGAAKAELVFGNWEWGIGGWYKYQKAPRFITTLSGSIAGKVSVFAEGVFAWGSDYTYYRNDSGLTAYEYKNKPFFQVTAGGSYSNSDTHTTLAFQYFYNGFGYADTAAPEKIIGQAAAAFAQGASAGNKALMDKFLNVQEMGSIGQHYLALSLSQNKIGTDKLSAQLFQQFAISEREGKTALTLRWNIYKFVSMNAGPIFVYPLSPQSNSKGMVAVKIGFKLGGGKF